MIQWKSKRYGGDYFELCGGLIRCTAGYDASFNRDLPRDAIERTHPYRISVLGQRIDTRFDSLEEAKQAAESMTVDLLRRALAELGSSIDEKETP